MKQYHVDDLIKSVGLSGSSYFGLARSEKRVTQAGKPYLDLTLQDRTGEISAKAWSDNLARVQEAQPGDVVEVEFEVGSYRNRPELTLRSLKKITEFDASELVLLPPGLDPEQLRLQLTKRIDEVRDFNLRKLLDNFFNDEEFKEAFLTVPAAEKVHHHYRHGLLQHTLEMLTILDSVLELYPNLNRDLLITGAILHDIGKTKENLVSQLGTARRSFQGRLVGHIALGMEMIQARLPKDFPDQLKVQLEHIILSHQGKLEWGSPILPATREALAIHFADMTSTYMNIIDRAHRNGRDGKENEREAADLFSEYEKYLGTQIYLGE